MRVCFVAHSSRTGGAERVLLETIEILKTSGVECKVLLPDRGEFCTELDRVGVPFSVVSFPLWMSRKEYSLFSSSKAALSTLVNTVAVAWKIYRWKCDQVYSNTVSVGVGAFAARLLSLPHIWHLHEFGKEDQGLSFLFGERFSLGIVNRLSSRCICVSTALAHKYEQFIAPSKITVIYPSMQLALKEAAAPDCSDFSTGSSKGRFRCVIVGALMEGKGQAESVLAFAHLKELGLDVELVVVGEGVPSYRSRLEELVAANQLETQVSFTGQIKNALPIMRSANAVLVCSRSEAFGRVTIEGMLAGKPVIGARSGATPELIKDGENGLLYTYGDPKDLAAKIRYLYQNPAIAEQLGKNAKSWVESVFTRERYCKEMLALLNPPLAPQHC